MALEIKQSLRLSQQLVMTPQLQQAIKLLQLNRLELADVVNQELMENPLLEEVAETMDNPEGLENSERQASSDPTVDAPASETTTGEEFTVRKDQQEKLLQGKEEFDWEAYVEDVNNNAQLPSVRMNTEDLPSFENILTKTTTMNDHLLWQLNLSQLQNDERKLGELIIGNLSDDGYLLVPVEDIAREANMQAEDAYEVLKLMQKFDPLGVCSRNLQECLQIQAEFMVPRNELVEKIISTHLPDLERKNYQNVARALGVSLDEVIVATKIILEFEPKPGRSFMTSDNTQYITPDIYVYKVGGEFVITLNEDGMPKLRVSSYYKNVLQSAKQDGNVTKEYIQDKLRSAVWLIRSIHNRQKTIYKVTESIVKHQRDFFDKGVGYLKPMILKDVAADIGMHESTVSRVTTNKFVHTPVGIFELKYFFNSSISSADGGADVASEAVKEKIRQMVSKEDATRPLSDQRIVELLRAENIDIARRTVAKYRDMLGILSSSKRKKIF
ncbi:MAG: RNA polymerase factor sigma-54 [Deltaproteobacteria bacterium]|nr:RNA polymerase factor sigma-54 [Deltaproteobacteria bacterium]